MDFLMVAMNDGLAGLFSCDDDAFGAGVGTGADFKTAVFQGANSMQRCMVTVFGNSFNKLSSRDT